MESSGHSEQPDTPTASVRPIVTSFLSFSLTFIPRNLCFCLSLCLFPSVYLFPLFPAAFHATGRVSSLPRRRNPPSSAAIPNPVTRLGSVLDPWQGGGIVLLAPRESSLIVIELIDTRGTWGPVELLVARSPGDPPKWESLSRCYFSG